MDAGISKYETYLDGKGVYGGVNDPRMGSLDDKEDPGHFGHIELRAAVLPSRLFERDLDGVAVRLFSLF